MRAHYIVLTALLTVSALGATGCSKSSQSADATATPAPVVSVEATAAASVADASASPAAVVSEVPSAAASGTAAATAGALGVATATADASTSAVASAAAAAESPAATASATPTPAAEPTGLAAGWELPKERVVGGKEADLVVRTGDINNLGYGWPEHFTPFSGKSTPAHPWPCELRWGAVPGTDRVMLGTGWEKFTTHPGGDGYAGCTKRPDNQPEAVTLDVGELPAVIHGMYVQIFVDDFQAPVWKSQFQVSLNDTRLPNFEKTINALDQTGPIGKLITLKLLPEYWPLVKSGTAKLYIDDPTTGAADGYAIDFVRLLVNPHGWRYSVIVHATVVDADTQKPIAGATVQSADETATTDATGKATLRGVPAGMVTVTADATNYDSDVQLIDLPAGEVGDAKFALKRHKEAVNDLKTQIAKTGSVAIYGIHFDTASAKLRPDSTSSLNQILSLIKGEGNSKWIIAGHTDNQGGAQYNLGLSDERAHSVVKWLTDHGIDAGSLQAKGYGLSRPVADNASSNGRALNRRVEVSIVK